MLLLFVLGVMNVTWSIALAALVIIEKHGPYERWLRRVTSAALFYGEVR